jgi:putative (di)nucleoside polyphosphate hydrolase
MKRSASLPAGYRPNVGIMLIAADRRVWIGQRHDRDPEAEQAGWQMPQGGIDKGETPAEAAQRELEEEVGTDKAEVLRESRDWLAYDLPPSLARALWKGRFRGQAQKWVAMRFTGHDSDIDIATRHPEFRAWRWAHARELPGLIVPFKRDVYRAVLEEFDDLVS